MEQGRAIDLDNPKDAKFFLRGARIAGKPIEHVILESGEQLSIENMTDEQLVRYAKDIYFDYLGGTEGVGGHIDLETSGLDQ